MTLLVKDYLLTHSLQDLEDAHGVCARMNATGDKFSLNYDQIMVKNGDRLAEQCRGLVLRPKYVNWLTSKDDWKRHVVGACDVLAWPMDRFYNHGDVSAASIDWNDANLRVYEKLDGTMMIVYWDPLHDRWHAGTRAVPEADLPIHKEHVKIGDMTFSELFFSALRATREASEGKTLGWDPTGFDQVVHLNKELTYVFELTTPYNRIVVKYDEPRVTLLAARHTASGKEVAIESLRMQHVQRPKTWELQSAAALAAFVNSADPALLEGAVVCVTNDSFYSFPRVKVKNKAWVLSSKAKDLVTVSKRSALLAIIKDEIDDVIPIVEKDIAIKLESMRDAVKAYFRHLDVFVNECKLRAQGSRKEFAQAVMSSGEWGAPCFALLDGRANTSLEWVKSMATVEKLSTGSLDAILGRLPEFGWTT